MIVAGVEEAGRGPVIGPMVMAICAINEEKIELLKNMGVKDSKLLSAHKREELFDEIKKICSYEIIILPALEIDDSLNNPSMNLNKLEGKTSAKLINSIKLDKVILDCPSNNISSYSNYVSGFVTQENIEIIAEHKADLNHTIVGAASILAKVTRDREILKIKQKIGKDFGSGYPSDPKTIGFLQKFWDEYPEIFRKTWATYKKVADSHKQKGLGTY